MIVAVIGCAASDILSVCHITTASLAKEGHRIYAILAPYNESEPSSSSSSSLSENTNVQQLAAIGITQTFLIGRFDYSAVTQSNADAINSSIRSVNPSVVIMPSWKSLNHFRKILARTSLIACRGVGTILMYELDANNTSFNPNITFEASVGLSLKQQQLDTNRSGYQRLEEKFESHRTLLLEEEGLFDSRIFVSDGNHKNGGGL